MLFSLRQISFLKCFPFERKNVLNLQQQRLSGLNDVFQRPLVPVAPLNLKRKTRKHRRINHLSWVGYMAPHRTSLPSDLGESDSEHLLASLFHLASCYQLALAPEGQFSHLSLARFCWLAGWMAEIVKVHHRGVVKQPLEHIILPFYRARCSALQRRIEGRAIVS